MEQPSKPSLEERVGRVYTGAIKRTAPAASRYAQFYQRWDDRLHKVIDPIHNTLLDGAKYVADAYETSLGSPTTLARLGYLSTGLSWIGAGAYDDSNLFAICLGVATTLMGVVMPFKPKQRAEKEETRAIAKISTVMTLATTSALVANVAQYALLDNSVPQEAWEHARFNLFYSISGLPGIGAWYVTQYQLKKTDNPSE